MRVRNMAVAASTIALAIALCGCSVKQALDAELTPEPKVVTMEATVAVAGASVEGTLTEQFPEIVPLWPGATVSKSKKTETPQGASFSAVLNTEDPYDDVVAGVGEGFKQSDWRVTILDASSDEQKAALLTISNSEADGIVNVTQMAGQPVRIEYVITPKE